MKSLRIAMAFGLAAMIIGVAVPVVVAEPQPNDIAAVLERFGLQKPPPSASSEIIGKWRDERIGGFGEITIYREDGQLYIHTFRPAEIKESQSPIGRRFDTVPPSDHGDFFVIDNDGHLQLHDREGLISTARRIDTDSGDSQPGAEPRDPKDTGARLKAEAEAFVKTGVGKKVPYSKWSIMGSPETMEGTDNRYWVAYLDKADVSFVSEKASDKVMFADFGRHSARDFLKKRERERTRDIQRHFSGLDGSHSGLTVFIKELMNDPSSYRHVKTVYWDMEDHLVVQTTFRGQNIQGDVVVHLLKAKVDLDGNVLEVLSLDP